ncbi:MAG: hypothetical protein IAI48_04595 [Candidatus Eremiobacteraeota bacterium]|nr:hypothetical protein [Candidatus Eremiobacteraeota bacterium]
MYDRHDERGVPISSGIPPIVIISAIIGLIMIATIVTLVFSNSAFGHAWPSEQSTKLPL